MKADELKMWKEACSKLQAMAYAIMHDVIGFVKGHTEEEPLILYDKENLLVIDEIGDDFYELPFAYYVGKHGDYNEGRIVEVQGENVIMVLSGDEFPKTWELELSQLPFESLVELMSYLEKRF